MPASRIGARRLAGSSLERFRTSVVDRHPDDGADDGDGDTADDRGDERIDGQTVRREAADRERDPDEAGDPCDQQQQAGVDDEPEQAERHHRQRQREELDDRLDHAVHDARDHRDDDQAGEVVAVIDLRQQVRDDRERDRRGDRADDEAPHPRPPLPSWSAAGHRSIAGQRSRNPVPRGSRGSRENIDSPVR